MFVQKESDKMYCGGEGTGLFKASTLRCNVNRTILLQNDATVRVFYVIPLKRVLHPDDDELRDFCFTCRI
jgi:hypothetical protein